MFLLPLTCFHITFHFQYFQGDAGERGAPGEKVWNQSAWLFPHNHTYWSMWFYQYWKSKEQRFFSFLVDGRSRCPSFDRILSPMQQIPSGMKCRGAGRKLHGQKLNCSFTVSGFNGNIIFNPKPLCDQGERGASGLDGRPGLDGKPGAPGPSGQRVLQLLLFFIKWQKHTVYRTSLID